MLLYRKINSNLGKHISFYATMTNYSKECFYRHNGPSVTTKEKVYFQDFHILRTKEDYEYPIHKHHNYELIVTDKAPYSCTLNNCELDLEKKQILIVKPGDWHKDHLEHGQIHYVLHFSVFSELSKLCINIFNRNTKPHNQIINRIPDIENLFKNLENENKSNDQFACKIQDSVTETFFWKIVRALPNTFLSDQFQSISKCLSFEKKIFTLFEKNCNQNLKTEKMAKYIGMSKRSMENYFQEYFKTSPARAFNMYRLKKGEYLLLNSSKTIKEISFMLGFNNQFHFSRVFKSLYKNAPSSYRKNKPTKNN
jgi:AraC-like DNA-binding protein